MPKPKLKLDLKPDEIEDLWPLAKVLFEARRKITDSLWGPTDPFPTDHTEYMRNPSLNVSIVLAEAAAIVDNFYIDLDPSRGPKARRESMD
jgi:hypothetical protein